jgi:hypothetical protein
MIVTDGKELCRVCKTKNSVVLCDGCAIPLCAECRTFDLWGYGCGHVDPKAFCRNCFHDVKINPYSGDLE